MFPYMEKIFRDRGVPASITTLTFVESMFNPNALSNVGASGIWQFMKSTGKEYLIVNRFIDERRSPLKATRAAAQFLMENYKKLKSWPLAITAYNFGPNAMRKAVQKLNTMNLSTIIREYKAKNFGYASKNFYAEFIAANRTYQYIKSRNRSRKPFKNNLSSLILSKKISTYQLLKRSSLDKETLSKYNLCLKKYSNDPSSSSFT